MTARGRDIDGVLLDIDDTLVDTKAAFAHAIAVVAVPHLRAGAAALEVTEFWRADRYSHYRAHARGETSAFEQRKLRVVDMHQVYEGPDLRDDEYVEWVDVFEQAFQNGWVAHPDAAPLLDFLDAEAIPYGALSNARFGYQAGKLAAVGLERVPMLVGVDTLGFGNANPINVPGAGAQAPRFVGKPDPRVFLLACEKLGTEPGQTLYVGDEFDIDGLGALNAGLQSAWLDRPGVRTREIPAYEMEAAEESGLIRATSLADVARIAVEQT